LIEIKTLARFFQQVSLPDDKGAGHASGRHLRCRNHGSLLHLAITLCWADVRSRMP
jgi:hypothetical protein